MIYVTHDQVEAMTLADKIVVLRAGRIEQVGAPMDLYRDPDNRFVAGFIGSPVDEFPRGRVRGGQVEVPALKRRWRCRSRCRPRERRCTSGSGPSTLRSTARRHAPGGPDRGARRRVLRLSQSRRREKLIVEERGDERPGGERGGAELRPRPRLSLQFRDGDAVAVKSAAGAGHVLNAWLKNATRVHCDFGTVVF